MQCKTNTEIAEWNMEMEAEKKRKERMTRHTHKHTHSYTHSTHNTNRSELIDSFEIQYTNTKCAVRPKHENQYEKHN